MIKYPKISMIRFSPGIILISLLFFISCKSGRLHPAHPFNPSEVPPSPDYSLLKYWHAHPEKDDPADLVPVRTLQNRQEEAEADVFFIHPTTFNSSDNWNQDPTDEKLNRKTANYAIKHQASVFNSAGRVYAPVYRQATLGSFWAQDTLSLYHAVMLAYSDVKRAFFYYLKNENQGRPFILASHSQGSLIAMMLLDEELDGSEISERMIAAYVPGWAIPADTFEVLKPCNSPLETGCYVTWNTWKWGHYPDSNHVKNAVVTNPLNWRSDGSYADMSCSKGMVLRGYRRIYEKVCDAKAEQGLLWVHQPDVPGKFFMRKMKRYHIADYNIFWMDVRLNAEKRVEEWLRKNARP